MSDNTEQLAAILGLLVIQNGGDFAIPVEVVKAGLPENSAVRVEFDEEKAVLVVGIRGLDDN